MHHEWSKDGAEFCVAQDGMVTASGPNAPRFDSTWIDELAEEILRLKAALAAERERCAKVCDGMAQRVGQAPALKRSTEQSLRLAAARIRQG
jgi:hypothetical protein